jgi:hypothetical protein
MNIFDKSEAAHRRKCIRRNLEKLAAKPLRVTKADILKDILAHFPRTSGQIEPLAGSKNEKYLSIETDHGKADRIGQYAMRLYGKQVYTYFACHVFRKARLAIYFK